MNKLFYPKLAVSNLKKNARIYVPYLLTCIGSVMMFYIISALAENSSLEKTYGGEQVKSFLAFGSWIMGIFSVIFLFYTNSFLLKQRKKELGLFNILGMEKRHIAKVIFLETLYTAVISLAGGLFGGILLSKLAELSLFHILHFQIQMGIEIIPKSIIMTLILFGCIYLLTLLNSLRQIHLANPIELLQGGKVGEKEPKAKWILAILGFICLGGGYYISLSVQSPVEAVFLFFVAIILVMLGTYCLFTAGSIAVLKILKKNKKFYYQTRHFTSISGMMYRMKQNAAGLANICILSTGVLIMLSTTFSLYNGMDDLLRSRFPRNIQISGNVVTDEETQQIREAVDMVLKRHQTSPKNVSDYQYLSLTTVWSGEKFSTDEKDLELFGSNMASLNLITLDDYKKMTGREEVLDSGEVLLYEWNGEIEGETIRTGELEYRIKERVDDLDSVSGIMDDIVKSYYLVVRDREEIQRMVVEGFKEDTAPEALSYYYGMDLDGDTELQKSILDELSAVIQKNELGCYAEGAEASRDNFFALYGSLLFLGIFLGLLFIMATVLIIYYKQVTEGYEDKERFIIMQKVGMSRKEVKSSIHSQVLTVFFLPLMMACVHTAFAYPVVRKILRLLNLSNTVIFIQTSLVTVVVFAVFYTIVYSLTAKAYYKIVSK